MTKFLHLTLNETGTPITLALRAIGSIEPNDWNGKPFTTITLSFGSPEPRSYAVGEPYEQVLQLIAAAEQPS
ncbi:MAG: hypothetical protein EOO62_22255 [Hymenobacter sp.]|nr:MAG: hypothetical protein EOO62_22255 [Hymenobacter sp.]